MLLRRVALLCCALFHFGFASTSAPVEGQGKAGGLLRLPNGRPAHLELKSPITYITDCKDENGKGRLKARLATLFPGHSVELVGVENDYEAGINLVDIADAYEGRPGIILGNVARREGTQRRSKWPNGPPFSWLRLGDNIDVFSTIDGYILSLLQSMVGSKLTVELFDIPSTVPHMGLPPARQEHIIHTQFRSFDFLPLLAAHIVGGRDLPASGTFADVPEMPHALCWVDSFGNIKTNCVASDASFEVGRRITIKLDSQRQLTLECYSRLKDIPDGVVGLTIGSSGMDGKRLLEIVQLGKSAANTLALHSGTNIEFVS
uniref:Uncharacterized protein n=2 Tax=Hemiselmis andersenii TaxID=464988 RepID=A0A6U4K6Q5_HEMAN|mmetsp:Transcript_21826/g.50659  ORF Transcript_21826/g.50659 Transcript_21826/m.50659 type:complete len:318 (+) Transcript_21826:104-1057(+)